MLDKLDYCASVHNLDAVKECHNFEVRSLLLFRDCSLIYMATVVNLSIYLLRLRKGVILLRSW